MLERSLGGEEGRLVNGHRVRQEGVLCLPYGTCKMEATVSVKVSPKIARRTDVIISLQRNDRL